MTVSSLTFIEIIVSSDEKELDSKMILQLSKKLTKKIDILTLGTIGLDMKEEVIEGQLKDNESEINMAALAMLKTWMRSQPDGKIAYRKLCEALKHPDVDMAFLIKDTFLQTVKYQSIYTSWKPPEEEVDENQEEIMEVDDNQKEGFNSGNVAFRKEHVKEELMNQEMSWPPSLLSLAKGTDDITSCSNIEGKN